MKRWIDWPQFRTRTNSGTPNVPGNEVMVQMHYRNGSNPDVIENFRVGQGSSFLLTFLEGGTVDLNLIHVREIKFEKVVHGTKQGEADVPNYHVKVALTNGRVLEGYSDSLHSFSGRREGNGWEYSCRGSSSQQVEARNNLARIVVRGLRKD